jgi:hypothetical protein
MIRMAIMLASSEVESNETTLSQNDGKSVHNSAQNASSAEILLAAEEGEYRASDD